MATRPGQLITKWSVFALLAALVGGGSTLSLDQLWLRGWASSGHAYPIGQRLTIELPAGRSLVYYESPESVPSANATLQIFTAEGDRIRPTHVTRDISYHLFFTGWSGRALWQLDLPTTGKYLIACYNHNVARDEDLHPDDRVVFLKNPDSIEKASFVRTFIQVTGATATMTAVMFLYLLHALALHRHARAGQDPAREPLAARFPHVTPTSAGKTGRTPAVGYHESHAPLPAPSNAPPDTLHPHRAVRHHH